MDLSWRNPDPLNNPQGNRRFMAIDLGDRSSLAIEVRSIPSPTFRVFYPITMQWSTGGMYNAYKISRALLRMRNCKNHKSLRTTRFLASILTK